MPVKPVIRVIESGGWKKEEIQKALRDVLLKVKLHKEQELFDRAYAYIREHY